MMAQWAAALAVALGALSVLAGSSLAADPHEISQARSHIAVRAANDLLRANVLRRARTRTHTILADAQPRASQPPLPQRKSETGMPATPEPDVWTREQITAAQAQCDTLLRTIDAVIIPQPPIKEGKCGAPAPVRLVSLGKTLPVSFSPPALVDCRMAAALNTWISQHVQPLAAKHLGERIVQVEVMSDYSCRRSSGRRDRLSQHAFADALDIRGFVTQSGRRTRVLQAWGETQRDIAARLAAEAAQDAAPPTSKTGADTNRSATEATASTSTQSMLLGTSKAAQKAANVAAKRKTLRDRALVASLSSGVPALALHSKSPPGPDSKFLRAAHAAACRIFGTTLGPEANDAHRNHFHVDMAERRYKRICD